MKQQRAKLYGTWGIGGMKPYETLCMNHHVVNSFPTLITRALCTSTSTPADGDKKGDEGTGKRHVVGEYTRIHVPLTCTMIL